MAVTKKNKTIKKTVAKKSPPKAKKTAAVNKAETKNKIAPVKKVVAKKPSPAKKATTKKTIAKASSAKVKPAVAKKAATKKTAKKAIMAAPAKSIVPGTEKPKAVVPVQKKQSAIQAVKEVKPVKEETKKDISYNPKNIEKKWQEKWEADKLYRSVVDENRPKHYALTMLPFPSGDLHIGHWYAMTPSDARARFMRMQGQPWKIIVVRDPERKKILRQCAFNQPKAEAASAVLIMIADPKGVEENWERVLNSWQEIGYIKPDAKQVLTEMTRHLYGSEDSTARKIFAVKNTALYTMSLMIAAKGLGVETPPMDGFDEECIKKEFRIPDDKIIPVLVAVGYLKSGMVLLPRPFRRELGEFVKFEKY